MTADTAGVDSKPSLPTHILPTPFAAAMRQMTGIAVSEKYLPSPETTRVLPMLQRTKSQYSQTFLWKAMFVRDAITFEVISRQGIESGLHKVLQVMFLLKDFDL